MATAAEQAQSIYIAMIREASQRLVAASVYQSAFNSSNLLPDLESSVLQIRKAMESIALATIAPNEAAYSAFRKSAEDQKDYTKDYHAKKIFRVLNKLNSNFYPVPLTEPTRMPDGVLFFGRKQTGFLTKKHFEAFYDRLGKHLHAHNPWSGNMHLKHFASELPGVIEKAQSLLELHATFIRTETFTGAWVVRVSRENLSVELITGMTQGEFTVGDA